MTARALQICNGLGAGNIGDELMNRAFWDALPSTVALDVELLPNDTQRAPYPPPHRYLRLDWGGNPLCDPTVPGLLVGDTPVTESLGLDWPLRFLAPRLARFHERGLPVDALGVGLEALGSADARQLFARHFAPIRSWTVRTSACAAALRDLGVAAERIVVGADWAWRYRPREILGDWAAAALSDLGIDPRAPLIVANVLNERWAGAHAAKRAIASALDLLATRHGFQVAFFCNESRSGDFFDYAAAAEIRDAMTAPAVIVPNLYYSPDETIALLRCATVALAGRYHFTVAAVLAEVPPIVLPRSAKMDGLLHDLELEPAGTVDAPAAADIVRHVLAAARERAERVARLNVLRTDLAARAARNLELWSA